MTSRQPAGIPTGGQFAPDGQSRAAVTLDGTDAFPDQLVEGDSRPTVGADGAIRDGRYDGMTRTQAWADYHRRHPEVLANWNEQNDRWPNDVIIGYTNADPSALSIDPDPEHFSPVDDERQDWCGVCGRPTDHFAEHDALIEAGLAEYRNGVPWKTDVWDDDLARQIREREDREYEQHAAICGEARPAQLSAALAYSTDENGRSLSEDYDTDDFDRAAVAQLDNDLSDFVRANLADLDGLDPKQIAHDFFLTRNHHGAGFWDRGLGDRGDRLTQAAHVYGSTDLYAGDDGKIHVS